MNSRREMLKLLGSVPVAGPAALAELGPLLVAPTTVAAAAAMSMTAAQGGPPNVMSNLLGPVIGKQVDRLMRAAEQETYIRRGARERGLDADIAALRSVSRVNQERRQIERDNADEATMRLARQMMWDH